MGSEISSASLVYIHGFASSPESRKARAFESTLERAGISLIVPMMDEGDFEHLTISSQLEVLKRTIHGTASCLVGSSMGGYLAGLYAQSHPEVSRLVLLAPAFAFAPRWRKQIGDPPPSHFEVFHYGTQTLRRVHYGLIEDALHYPSIPHFSQPGLIFHGVHDTVIPIDYSRAFVESHPNARLVELDSDHELLDVLDRIVEIAAPFLVS